MEGLDPAIEHLGKGGELADFGDIQSKRAQ